MDSALLLVLGALVGALLAIAAWWLRRAPGRAEPEAARLAQNIESLEAAQRELAGRLSQLAESQANAQATLNKTLEQSATRTAGTLGELKQHLNVIDQAQKNISELAGQVVGLQDILANKQARGAFGEIQLNDIVTSALPPSAYSFQSVLSNGKRADCLIKLPNPPGPIVIDAKFPLESYRALRAAEDEATRTTAGRAFSADILKHVRDIAERYVVPGETAESALMFLPSEAVYAELHANFPEVVVRSYRAKVWIVSPTTLMATLNTVRAVLKDARMREQAGVIQTEVLRLLEDVVRLQDRVDNLKRHFAQAEGDIKKIDTSAEKIVRKAGQIEELQLEEGEAAEDAAAELTGATPRLVGE
jgi:DNA recombination protein RmuC